MEAKHLIAPAIAVLLAVGGILILTEVVRPFRDLRSDGPLAVVLLAAGLVLAILGLLDTPTEGTYLLNGHQVAHLSLSERARVRNREIDPMTLFIGEVGLGGELRSVTHVEARIAEAEKMGFQRIIIPKGNRKSLRDFEKIEVVSVATAYDALKNAVQ
mgnify:CR=1 FL=1